MENNEKVLSTADKDYLNELFGFFLKNDEEPFTNYAFKYFVDCATEIIIIKEFKDELKNVDQTALKNFAANITIKFLEFIRDQQKKEN